MLQEICDILGPENHLFYKGPEAQACAACTQGRYWLYYKEN